MLLSVEQKERRGGEKVRRKGGKEEERESEVKRCLETEAGNWKRKRDISDVEKNGRGATSPALLQTTSSLAKKAVQENNDSSIQRSNFRTWNPIERT